MYTFAVYIRATITFSRDYRVTVIPCNVNAALHSSTPIDFRGTFAIVFVVVGCYGRNNVPFETRGEGERWGLDTDIIRVAQFEAGKTKSLYQQKQG